MKKSNLRSKYGTLRANIPEEKQEELSIDIANKTLELDIWNKTYYHIFLSIPGKHEVNTEYILHILQGRDKSIVVSKSNMKSGELQHYLLQENTVVKPSEYGIPEPVEGIEIPVSKLEVVFVPLLAFDLNGHRVGYGKGFYDRFLSECGDETLFVGLSFFEAEEKLDHTSLDIPLHYCITPKKTHRFI